MANFGVIDLGQIYRNADAYQQNALARQMQEMQIRKAMKDESDQNALAQIFQRNYTPERTEPVMYQPQGPMPDGSAMPQVPTGETRTTPGGMNMRGALAEMYQRFPMQAMQFEQNMRKAQGDPFTLKEGERRYGPTGNVIAEAPQGGPFSGQGLDQQVYNTIIEYNNKKNAGIQTDPREDMAYYLAHQKAGKPYITTTSDGRTIEVPGMDLRGFAVPGGFKPSGGMAPPVQGVAGGKQVGKRQYPEYAGASAGFANRMYESEKILSGLESTGYAPENLRDQASNAVIGGNFLRTPEGQKYRQAQENWVRANLRKESGAVIGADEMDREIKTYFPIAGDKTETIAQKAAARADTMENMRNQSQGAYDEWFGGKQAIAPKQQPKAAPKQTPTAPKLGTRKGGYVFIGGDPADPKSWKVER